MAEEYAELNKQEVIYIYKQKCEEVEVEPHLCFIQYLEDTMDDTEALEVVI